MAAKMAITILKFVICIAFYAVLLLCGIILCPDYVSLTRCFGVSKCFDLAYIFKLH